MTSGLPDDCREADEKAAERRLRELRGRVKAARALVAATPGLAETLARDWLKAARFYAHFGITETQYRNGVPVSACQPEGEHPGVSFDLPPDLRPEARSRGETALPV